MYRPWYFFVGLRLVRSKHRSRFLSLISLASMAGLALGVFALIVVLSVMNGFQSEMKQRLLGMTSHLVVMPKDETATLESMTAFLQTDERIMVAAPLVQLDGMVTSKGRMQPIQIDGVDPIGERSISSIPNQMVGGTWSDLSHKGSMILGAHLASRLQLNVGDSLVVVVPKVDSKSDVVKPMLHTFKVVGLYQSGTPLEVSQVYISTLDAKQLKGESKISQMGIRIQLKELNDASDVVVSIKKEFPVAWHATTWMQTHGSLFGAMQMEKIMVSILLTFILLVAVFNIVASLTMVVTEKRPEIAILRSMGASPNDIQNLFLVQGLVIGISGTLIGLILGCITSLNISSWMAWIEKNLGTRLATSDLYFINTLPSVLDIGDVWRIGLMALALSLIATLYPARRAAQLMPAEALRFS